MRKVFNYVLLLAAIFTYSSCTSEVDDIFSKSSSERLEEKLAETKTILESASNGWVMYYYGNTQYGGYNVLCKFENGKVKVASDYFTKFHKEYKEDESEYKLEQSAGAILSFHDYNEVFHFFSAPKNSDGLGEDDGKGFGGDLEFRIMKTSNDSIILTGKKHGNRIVMVRMPSDVQWSDYLDQIIQREEEMTFGQYNYVVGTDTVKVTNYFRNLIYTYTDDKGESVRVRSPYIVTPEGYEFYSSMELLKVTSKRMKYVGGDKFQFDSDNGQAHLYGVLPPITDNIADGTWWFMTYAGLGETPKPWWDTVRDALKKQTKYPNEKWDLRKVWFVNNTLNVLVGSTTAKFTYKMEVVGEDKVTFTYVEPSGADAKKVLTAVTIPIGTNLLKPLAGVNADGTVRQKIASPVYTVTTDNPRYPTWLKFVSAEDENHSFTFYKDEKFVYDSYDD